MTGATHGESEVGGIEFDDPPADPLGLLASWLEDAERAGVVQPTAAALATVDRYGWSTSRTIRILHLSEDGIVFSSHSVSRKGRDADATGAGSAVLYWPETGQQITLAGRLAVTTTEVSDRLWADRPSSTYAMSVATVQSAPLHDEEELRAQAAQLAVHGDALRRPESWVGFELVPYSIEFWHVGTERLHRRLRYDKDGERWTSTRLQP